MSFRPPKDFLSLSARLGQNPLLIQGAGGNTSIKADGRMWVKASGTELGDAETKPIFVEVDRAAALAEAHGAGDGSCQATVIDPNSGLRPSIETTFHAAFDWPVVAHTHSVAALVHTISPEGRAAAAKKLAGLPAVFASYRRPGLSLTTEVLGRIKSDTQIVVLENHGLICCGENSAGVESLIDEVEHRLALPAMPETASPGLVAPGRGYVWVPEAGGLATDPRLFELATSGSYYPDHVVFLGPALPQGITADPKRPACLIRGKGALIRSGATPGQRAMLVCLYDVLSRLPADWTVAAIGPDAEADLLDWDAEKYRQTLGAG